MRRVLGIAVVVSAVVFAAVGIPLSNAGTSERFATEKAALGKLAKILVEQLVDADHGNEGLLLDELVRSAPLVIAIRKFPTTNTKVRPAVGKLFNNLLRSAVIERAEGRITFVAREEIEDILDDQIEIGEFDPGDSDAITTFLSKVSADVLLIGNLERFGSNLMVTYKALDNQGQIRASVDPQELPWSSDYEEDHSELSVESHKYFGDWLKFDAFGPIDVRLSIDKGSDIGSELLTVKIKSELDVWLYCYHLQEDGKVFQIFPNNINQSPRIPVNGTQTAQAKLNRPIEEPELVKCFAVKKDISARLPSEFFQKEFVPLPSNMKFDLPRMFRTLENVVMTEASLVISNSPR